MKAIHLIQKYPDLLPWPVENESTTYESGYWKLTPERAQQLIRKKIFFHKKKSEASFFGGIIESYRIMEDHPWEERVIFRFKALRELKGKVTETTGWKMEMKFVE